MYRPLRRFFQLARPSKWGRDLLGRSVVTKESILFSSQLQTSMSPESNVAALFINTSVHWVCLLTILCNVYLCSCCYISSTYQRIMYCVVISWYLQTVLTMNVHFAFLTYKWIVINSNVMSFPAWNSDFWSKWNARFIFRKSTWRQTLHIVDFPVRSFISCSKIETISSWIRLVTKKMSASCSSVGGN